MDWINPCWTKVRWAVIWLQFSPRRQSRIVMSKAFLPTSSKLHKIFRKKPHVPANVSNPTQYTSQNKLTCWSHDIPDSSDTWLTESSKPQGFLTTVQSHETIKEGHWQQVWSTREGKVLKVQENLTFLHTAWSLKHQHDMPYRQTSTWTLVHGPKAITAFDYWGLRPTREAQRITCHDEHGLCGSGSR